MGAFIAFSLVCFRGLSVGFCETFMDLSLKTAVFWPDLYFIIGDKGTGLAFHGAT